MKLEIYERLVMANILPEKENLLNMIIIEDIKEKIKLSQEEITKFEIKSDDGKLTWKNDSDSSKEIEFTEAEISIISNQIDNLDKNKEITTDMVSVIRKIKG